MSAEQSNRRLTVMVSSTVYATLTTFGYDVWMSHKGTLPVMGLLRVEVALAVTTHVPTNGT
jgi:hypothetical protein